MKRTLPAYLRGVMQMKTDPLFKPSTVDRGLQLRPPSPKRTLVDRTNVAKRIIDAYKCMSEDQKSKRNVYKPSYQWVDIFEKPLMPLITKLNEGDAAGLRDLLDNFFRNSTSYGLYGLPIDMERALFSRSPSRYTRTLILIDMVYRYRLLQKLMPDFKISDLHVDDFGNPYGIYVEDQFLRGGFDYQFYYANRVTQLLEHGEGHSTVAELGGGYGGFAHFLMKVSPTPLTYIDLDLPEILCVASYQLLNLFPEKRFLLYGETEHLDSSVIAAYDVALLPCFAIESLVDDSVDVSFNSYSLAEMDSETIQNYTSHFSRISRKAILHVNHVRDVLLGADQFPFDMTKFELANRTRALWNFGMNHKCDEYEFLLTRRGS